MQPFPLITIAIPVFNAERTIERCINSALEQDWPNLEVIVSNNSSDDSTRDILSQFSDSRLKIFHQPTNIGMNENFRFCLDKAEGAMISFLNADDYLLEGSITEKYDAFNRHEGAILVASDARWEGLRTGAFEAPFGEYTDGLAVAETSLSNGRNYFHFSCTLAPTDLVREMGLSNNMFFDWVLWLRLMLRGSVVHVAKPLTVLTDHAQRQTRQRMKLKGDHCSELQGVLDEFAEIESLSNSLVMHKIRGRRLLLRHYLRVALEDYQQARSKARLHEERQAFLKSNRSLTERFIITVLLTFPNLSFFLWKAKTGATGVFRA